MRDLYPDQPDADSVPDCATAGVLGVTTSVVGGLMATEVIKFLTGVGEAPVGALHMYDALTTQIRSFTVRHDPGRELVTAFSDYEAAACAVPAADNSELLDAVATGAAVALDVREEHEKALEDISAATGTHIPTSRLEENPQLGDDFIDSLPEGTDVLVYCASGKRSQGFVDKHAAHATQRGVTLTSLPGGVNAL